MKPDATATPARRAHLPRRCLPLTAIAVAGWLCVCTAAGADWRDTRAQLDARGVGFEALYSGESATVLSGGARRATTWHGLAEARLSLDGARLAGWRGARGFVHLIRPHGGDPADDTGDAQGVSNIAASSRGRVLEAWLQQNLLQDRLSLLAGRYDLNSEFYLLQSSGLFLNSSFGIGPEFSQTGVAGPSLYPDTAIAARIEARPAPGLALRAAVINGVPAGVARADGRSGIRRSGDGLLFVGEAGLVWPASADAAPAHAAKAHRRAGRGATQAEHDGKAAVGAWRYRARFPHVERTQSDGSPLYEDGGNGVYMIAEQTLSRDAGLPQRRLRGFVQLGFGDADIARFARYLGAGVTLSAPLAARPDDIAGLAFASARNGSPYLAAVSAAGGAAERAETTVELTWLAALGERLSMQPSLQYVIDPGTDPGLRDAVAALLRFEITL